MDCHYHRKREHPHNPQPTTHNPQPTKHAANTQLQHAQSQPKREKMQHAQLISLSGGRVPTWESAAGASAETAHSDDDEDSSEEEGYRYDDYTPAALPDDVYGTDDDSDSADESDEDTAEAPRFDFCKALANRTHMQTIKVEPEDKKGIMHVGMIMHLAKERILIKAGVNRGSQVIQALDIDPGNAATCTVWKSNDTYEFLKAMANGEETLTTHCRLVVRDRHGESKDATDKLVQRNRNKGFTYRKKGKDVTLEIYDGCNRVKVFLMFITGGIAVEQCDKSGDRIERLYHNEKFALRAKDAYKTPNGDIKLNDGIAVLDDASRAKFDSSPWNLYILHGTAQQCATWARNFNMKNTPFQYHQEMMVLCGSFCDDSYGGQIIQLTNTDWLQQYMADTSTVNGGMIITYALLKLHGIYTKPSYLINTPGNVKFDQLKRECESESEAVVAPGTVAAVRIEALRAIFERLEKTGKALVGDHSLNLITEDKRRRFRMIACAIIDNEIDGVQGTDHEFKKRATQVYNTSHRSNRDAVHDYLRMKRPNLPRSSGSRSTKRKSKVRSNASHHPRGACRPDDAVLPEKNATRESQASEREKRASQRRKF